MEWIEPVINRSLADVEEVKSLKERIYAVGWSGLTTEEQGKFLGDMVGTLNYITLNRIEGNTLFLEEAIRDLGFIVAQLQHKRNWTLADMPNKVDLARLRDNIEQLQAEFYYLITSLPDDLNAPNYEQINAVERVLAELKTATELIMQSWKYCGTFACGQGLVLPQRS